MPTNYSNNFYGVISDNRSIPFNQALTGTIRTDSTAVVGVGTKFRTEMPVGSWLLDIPNNELRKVIQVDSDTDAYLDEAFTTNIPALSTGQVIPEDRANPIEMSIEVTASNPPAELFGVSFTGILCASKASSTRSGKNDRVDPWIVDGTGTEIRVFILY